MKKNITKSKTTKTSKKSEFVPKLTTATVDITGIQTDNDMVYALAVAKINAGRSIDVSEFMNVIGHEKEEHDCAICKVICESFNEQIKLCDKISQLENELAWAKRPWYKKLMFWKKQK